MKKLKRSLGNLLFLLKPQWKYGKAAFLLRVVPTVVMTPINTLLSVNLPRVVIDAIAAKRSAEELLGTLALYLSAMLALSLIQNILSNIVSIRENVTNFKIAKLVHEHALKVDFKYFDDPAFFNTYTFALQQYSGQTSMALQQLQSLLSFIATFAALFAYVVTLGPWLVLIAAVPILLRIPIQLYQNKLGHKQTTEVIPLSRRANALAGAFSTRAAAADIKSTRLAHFIFSSYEKGMLSLFSVLKNYALKSIHLNTLSNIVSSASNFAMMAYLALGVISGRVGGGDIGVYVSLLNASQTMSSYVQVFISMFTNLNSVLLQAETIREFFEWESVIEPQIGGETPSDKPFAVELKDASFSYPGSAFSLKNLSLSIKPGEKIGIVGENGAGKSTFAKLLLRLYDADSGEILIDGRSIREYDVKKLRRSVGIAFQTTNLYALPLSVNLRLYNDADDETLLEILKKVRLDGVLEKNGATLETEVTKEFDDSGIMLSGGETQKLGLARLLTGRFGLLLLDEPSSALDPIAEYELARLLFNRENPATTIMIAHRLSTVRDADMIYLMADGEIAERGTHAELMSLGGRYCEMFTKQAENYTKTDEQTESPAL